VQRSRGSGSRPGYVKGPVAIALVICTIFVVAFHIKWSQGHQIIARGATRSIAELFRIWDENNVMRSSVGNDAIGCWR